MNDEHILRPSLYFTAFYIYNDLYRSYFLSQLLPVLVISLVLHMGHPLHALRNLCCFTVSADHCRSHQAGLWRGQANELEIPS